MTLKNLYLIVAVTKKTHSIGKNGNLIHFVKEDMDFFKEKTYNNTIICGRKTFESFKIKPLPKRKNIVLTRGDFSFKDVITFNNIDKLLKFIKENEDEKFFICGGESVYKELMPYCYKMFVTFYSEDENVDADSHFPKIDEKIWKVIDKKMGKSKEIDLEFYTFEKIL